MHHVLLFQINAEMQISEPFESLCLEHQQIKM